MDGVREPWARRSGRVIATMSSRLWRPGKGAGGNLDWKKVELVQDVACICVPVQNIEFDEVVQSRHSRPDQVRRRRHQMVPDAVGNIDAVSEQGRRRRGCAWLVGGRKDLETMDAEIGMLEAGCRGGAGVLRTLFVKIVSG
jgi:hypothetical protein